MNTLTLDALFNQIVPKSDQAHQSLSNLPTASRGIIGLSDKVRLMTDSSGNWIVPDNAGGLYKHVFAFTTPTADRTMTFGDASGVVNPSTAAPGAAGAVWFEASTVVFEGATADAFETRLTVGDPTVDRTFTLPDCASATIATVPSALNASGAGTVALTAAQSGQTFLLDAASGVVYTLPAPVVGLSFNFQVSVSVTSNSHEVRTNTATVLIGGVLAQVGSDTTFGFLADRAATQAYKANGTTTGGKIGTQFTLSCVSATLWQISGINVGSGTAATPFTATP